MNEIKYSFSDKRKREEYIYTTIKYKNKREALSMNKVKKVLMTMFGLLMFPYYLLVVTLNPKVQVQAIAAKGKLVVALNPEFAPFE